MCTALYAVRLALVPGGCGSANGPPNMAGTECQRSERVTHLSRATHMRAHALQTICTNALAEVKREFPGSFVEPI